ncbi:MAG: aminoglycoside phosphotransferase family protein [Alphaproteobacteria bacterium]
MAPAADRPAALRPWLARWRLTPEAVLGRSPWSLAMRVRRDGRPLVLKLVDPATDEMNGAPLLARFGGRGAVRLLARDGAASLLECAQPGRPLAALVGEGRDDAATRILCTVAQALHQAPIAGAPCPTVARLGAGFARIRRHPRRAALPPATLDRAAGLYRDLAASQDRRVLLHGDLHHENVLFDAGRGWLAIDPKGALGEPAWEAGAALRNPLGPDTPAADPETMARRVAVMAEMLALDRRRILGWCAAQAVLAAIWSIEAGRGRPVRLAHWLAVADCAWGLPDR